MTDIFEEVEEQLRSDKYRQLAIRIWPWVAGVAAAALLAALAAWGYQSYSAREAAKASETYAAAMEQLDQGGLKQADAAFGQVAKSPARGFAALALMQQAGIRLTENRVDEAVPLFDKAASATPDPIVGDFARLKSAFALMDTAPYNVMEARLTPLTDNKRPYHIAAREALAFAKLQAGRTKAARDDFEVLEKLLDTPDSTRQRVGLAIAAIDSGSAAAIPAAVKAALQLPPQTLGPVPSPPSAPEAGGDE